MSKKIIALLFAVLMAATVASAATMVKSTDMTVTSKGGKVVKTVAKKHFKRTNKKVTKSTTIKSTTIPTPPPAK
jgi:ABC-type oligopeptide transport system substrate-binding subunit